MKSVAAARIGIAVSALAAILSGASAIDRRAAAPASLDVHAARYLRLAGDLAALNPESVDFLLGTPDGDQRRASTFAAIAAESRALVAAVREASAGHDAARAQELARQLEALSARSDQLGGRSMALDEELRRMFALDPATIEQPADDGEAIRNELARRLPGNGALSVRLSDYQRRFIIPRARLDAIITRAIAACRNQTARFLTLPGGESLTVQYVADRPWSGYSVYRGNYESVMQVNRVMPLTIGQALNLACHEGYPGHHTYNSLREAHARNRSRSHFRDETATLLIFSPDGFRAEAMAAAAAAMAFSTAERTRIFHDELLPLAGLDPGDADAYANISDLMERLTATTTRIVRRYLAGELTAADAAAALEREALMEQPDPLVAYIDRYRAYALAYTWGRDRLLSSLTADGAGPDTQWGRLRRLMASPQLQDRAIGTGPAALR